MFCVKKWEKVGNYHKSDLHLNHQQQREWFTHLLASMIVK